MSRPRPTVILSNTDERYVTTEVLPANAVYALGYDGEPIDLRRVSQLTGKIFYPTTAATAPQHLNRLAAKLNERFNTDKFTVIETLTK